MLHLEYCYGVSCVDDRKVVAQRQRCYDARGCADVGVRTYCYGICGAVVAYMLYHVMAYMVHHRMALLWHIWYCRGISGVSCYGTYCYGIYGVRV
jgi:hypothetical protein